MLVRVSVNAEDTKCCFIYRHNYSGHDHFLDITRQNMLGEHVSVVACSTHSKCESAYSTWAWQREVWEPYWELSMDMRVILKCIQTK